MASAKEKYRAFIKGHYAPLFFRDFYLDVVCDGNWDVILYYEEDKIAAAYFYMLKQKMGIQYIVQPQLCPYTGPIFFDIKNTDDAYQYFMNELPKHHLIIQDYFYTIPKSKVDQFTTAEKHTYILDKNVDVEELWAKQSSTHRRIIRKADRELVYETVEDMDSFWDFVSSTFERRGKSVPNNPGIFKKLDKVLAEKGMRKIVKCTNNENIVVAMCYLMQDEQWTYNFANSVIEDYKHYGMNLILWNEIKSTLADGRSFDFEGSMIPGVNEFFKRFKGEKTFYQSRYKSANKAVDFLVNIKNSTVNKWFG